MSPEELRVEVDSLSKSAIAKEVSWWLCENVKNFIDTNKTSYSLSFLAHEEMMPQMAKLEALCRQIDNIEIEGDGTDDQISRMIEDNDEVEEASKMQVIVIDFLEDVRLVLSEDEELTNDVLKAFSYYKDFVGFDEQGKDITRPLTGFVEFSYLSFENSEMSVTITSKIPVLDSMGRLKEYKIDKENEKTLEMPASFCLDIVVQLWEDKGELSLF
jgi:hypothetical protein